MAFDAQDLSIKLDKYIQGFARGKSTTLVNKVVNKGMKDSVTKKFMGYYTHAQFSAILDKRVCELCYALDGHIISTSREDFINGTWDPPLHPYCRCMWIFIGKPEGVKDNWNFNKDFVDEFLDKGFLKELHWKGL